MESQEHQPTQNNSTNTNAIIALVASLLGLVGFAVIGPILGIVFARMAKKEIATNGQEGLGMAKAAEIIAWVQIVLGILLVLGLIVLLAVGFLASSAN